MRYLFPQFALALVVGLGSLAWAQDPVAYCECSQGEFGGPGNYAYPVDSGGYPISEFYVGTNDPELSNYTNVSTPPGWNFEIHEWGMSQSYGRFTYHTYMSEPPGFGLTAGSAHWWTDDPALAIESFTFGFDHPWIAQDVGWGLMVRWGGSPPVLWFDESWDAPVGAGAGPLHGPGDPPATCWLPDGCDPDDYCFMADCFGGSGVCVPRPTDCTEHYDPVCGCDGITYGNPCIAASEGVTMAYHAICLTGDLDLDADVDFADLSQLLCNYGTTSGATRSDGDLDGDGDVDLTDLAELLAHYGDTR